jgi:plastocyanin
VASGTGSLAVTVEDERGRPLEGAVVWLQGEAPRTPVPSEHALLEQKDLAFRPPLLVARKGQTLEVRNDDAELHNVDSPAECCRMNVSMIAGATHTRVLDAAGEATFLCDIHSHMRCVVLVLDADFARTGPDGRAVLEGVSAGARRLQVYALDRPRFRGDLEVAPGAPTPVAVKLEPRAVARLVEAPEKLPWPALAAKVEDTLAAAERWASLGDAASARESCEEALGRWYSGSGLYDAVRQLDAAEVDQGRTEHKGRADELKSALRRCAPKAEAAASAPAESRSEPLARLREHDAHVASALLEIARELPRREPAKGERP